MDEVFLIGGVICVLLVFIALYARYYTSTHREEASIKKKRIRRYNGPKHIHAKNTPKQQTQRRKRSKSRKSEPPRHPFVPCNYTPFYKPLPFPTLPPEVETGNIEYKLKLDPPTEERFQQLVTQMKYRIVNGSGQALYEIGVHDDGTPIGISKEIFVRSLETLSSMAQKLGASIQILKVRDGETTASLSAEVLVRKLAKESDVGNEVRVALCGDVDAGKSTLLGVLSSGELDNGRGQARMNIFKHKHELENGRTSAIGREILGFDQAGNIVNYSSIQTPTWSEIIENSAKVVCFMDLAGHKRYFKTTVGGMTGSFPDYAMLLIGAKAGTIGMTREHYNLTLALQIPAIIVVTKIDICPPNALHDTIDSLKSILQSKGRKKTPLVIQSEDDVIQAAKIFYSEEITPIFQISNVTGKNLDLLRLFFSLVNPMKDWRAEREKHSLLYVDDTFSVTDVGTVISGTLLQGKISVDDTLKLGPTQDDEFISVSVSSIHSNRLPVEVAYAGQSICVALDVERELCRKGQALVSNSLRPEPVWEFEASVCLISESSVIPQKYETVVHCGCSKQTAILLEIIDEESFCTGAAARVRFQYKYRAEYILPGDRFVFREAGSGGVGTVLSTSNRLQDNSKDSSSCDILQTQSTKEKLIRKI